MNNISLQDISCFGFSLPKKDCWFQLLHKVNASGWKSIDFDKFQKSLSDNVEACYYRMVGISFKNIDTDQEFFASFDNSLKKWTLEIPGSPEDAVLLDDKKGFFGSEEFKKTCKRADEILSQAVKSYDGMLKQKVEAGEFLDVNESKLEAIIHWLSDPSFRRNLKLGKYEK